MERTVNPRRGATAAILARDALLVTLCIVPAGALGWGGTPHSELGEDIGQSFSPEVLKDRYPGYPFIERAPALRPFPIIPEIDLNRTAKFEGGDPRDDEVANVTYALREILHWNAMTEDDYDLVDNWGDYDWNVYSLGIDWIPAWPLGEITITHFWDADDALMNTVESPWFTDVYPNAWFKSKILWSRAIAAWAAGDKASAYMYLGHVLHLLVDQGLACHAHDDWHAIEDDAMEDWFYGEFATANLGYSWSKRSGPASGGTWPTPPGGLLVPLGTDQVISALTAAGSWADDPELMTASPYGLQQLFYLMYTVNQYGDFSPSDGAEGDSNDRLQWADYHDGIIAWENSDGEPLTDGGSETTINVNDAGDDDTNGNLSLILQVGWRAAWRAAPMLVDLFRKTVDNVPPLSDVVVSRADGAAVAEWNNSPVTVQITNATTDGARTDIGMPASGVWKLWGEVEGYAAPSDAPDGSIYWAIASEGTHAVKLMSTDMMGNVEGPERDFVVSVDLTPPEITLLGLRPNYLTSQDFVPLWSATDATSGVAEETAYLDGQLVLNAVPIDLSQMAGVHTLEVYAWDLAGNWRYETYRFEVWIDTATFALPTSVNSNSGGEGLMVFVEFPAPYDVGGIDVATSVLRASATIDLTAPFPVVDGFANIPGEVLTGVADRDRDGLGDRSIRFDRALFLAPLGGVAGDATAVVWGGLGESGTPRFVGYVAVSVFTPPRK